MSRKATPYLDCLAAGVEKVRHIGSAKDEMFACFVKLTGNVSRSAS